jgi:cytochrome c553
MADEPAIHGAPDTPIEPGTLDRPWRVWASLAVVTALVLGALFAFLILPQYQRENAGLDLWTAMCRSLGIVEGSPAYPQPVSTAQAIPVSRVEWGPQVLGILALAQPERGAQIAGAVCVACHGERGVSVTPELPSLNGQTAAAIYKQLYDYRTGARFHPQMTPVAKQLKVTDLAHVASYFGRDAEPGVGLGDREHIADLNIERLATEGAPERRIPACNSCHVNGSGGPIETPTLSGQHRIYLENQLKAYRSGQRRNDVYQRMRAIARELTDEEITQLARYYQGVV